MHKANIVIFCSDPRPEKANLWKDIKRLLIPTQERWIPLGILGGPISLANPADLPIDYACILGQIEFAMREFNPKGFVLVGHDCGYYKRILRLGFTVRVETKMNDVAVAANFLRGRFPTMSVSAFFKKPHDGFKTIS
jgi:hypothetical protein